MSKYRFKNSSIYIGDSDLPLNKLSITDPLELHAIENELLIQAYELFYHSINEHTVFDEAYFISMHKATFSSLYDWAGEYRTLDMAKGDSRFCLALHLHDASKKIFDELSSDDDIRQSNELPKDEFAKKLAYYKCELIALHPFYELNGRITRMFFDMIAAYNGYEFIDYSQITPEAYIDASIECVQFADCGKMEKIILEGLHQV
jgi:cell filamentation protein